jgi:Domain of unknown function (DUF4157)
MSKRIKRLPEHTYAVPSKSQREDLAASDRALQPLEPSAILQRAALAPESLRPADIQRLQQTLGNRAVGQFLSQLSPLRSLIQAKLTVNAPGDKYEQEADRIAEMVTRTPAVRRAASDEEEDEDEKPEVMARPQPSPVAGGAFEADEGLEQQLRAARGQGQSLPSALKEDLETKFGADFSGVRVHTGARAGALNRSIEAEAFTAGRDVFFRQGAYDPGCREGQKLIAHELSHVLQQQAAGGGAAARIVQRMPQDPDENEPPPQEEEKSEAEESESDQESESEEEEPEPEELEITSETIRTAPGNDDRTRRDVGVCEHVTFEGNATGKWTVTGGMMRSDTGKPTQSKVGENCTWQAPNKAGPVTVTLEVGIKSKTLSMNVLEPHHIEVQKISEIADFEHGKAGAGMKLNFIYHPTRVSFGNVSHREEGGPAENKTGYYVKRYGEKQPWHRANLIFGNITENNTSEDTALVKEEPPYEEGSFTWHIPNLFKGKNEPYETGKEFTKVTQSFSIDSKGTMTVTKGNASVTRRVDET